AGRADALHSWYPNLVADLVGAAGAATARSAAPLAAFCAASGDCDDDIWGRYLHLFLRICAEGYQRLSYPARRRGALGGVYRAEVPDRCRVRCCSGDDRGTDGALDLCVVRGVWFDIIPGAAVALLHGVDDGEPG